MAFKTRLGHFGVDDADIATLPVQTPRQGNKSRNECRPWIGGGWSGWNGAGRLDSLCNDALGMPPAGESVIDGLGLGRCDLRWDDCDIVRLCGLGDGLGVVHR